MRSKEGSFQDDLIHTLEDLFEGCIVLKNDSGYIQGVPDLLILWNRRWAALEVKKSEYDYIHNQQPNQEYYVDLMDKMSFAAFIFPENKREVLDALSKAFRARR